VQQVSAGESGIPLDFLGSGPLPPNPAEILGSDRMRTLMDELRTRYEAVIFDAPPLNLVTDAALLGRLADTTILVARSNVTDQRALRQAASQLHFLHVPVAGLVLNDVNAASSSYYGYGKYGYSGR
jgi:capsular exopolysaccharide synthesis family protein